MHERTRVTSSEATGAPEPAPDRFSRFPGVAHRVDGLVRRPGSPSRRVGGGAAMHESCHSVWMLRRSVAGGLAFAAASVGSLAVEGPVSAASTITVTTTVDELDDDGNCSLREAVLSANLDAPVDACDAGSGADTIVVPSGTYVLSIQGAGEAQGRSGDLDIDSDVTIESAGAVVDAAGIDRALDVHAGATVMITGLTVRGGYVLSDLGGGIYNAGSLELVDSIVTANVGDLGDVGPSSGAGIGNDGELTLLRTRVGDNALGQIFPAGSGGGVLNRGTLTVRESTITGNRAWDGGGGIGNLGTASLVDSTVSGNGTGCVECAAEGGGIYTSGILTV